MKRLVAAWFAFVLVMSVVGLAQDAASPDNTKPSGQEKHKTMGHTKAVTGCLQKGDEPGEFSITGKDGKTWGLHSKTVKLEQHVGHEVTVTGSTASKMGEKSEMKEEMKEEKKEGQMEKASGKEDYRDLNVTRLKMISETCGK